VNIGDRVQEGQTIAIIEALGKLTAVTAPRDGIVIEVLAEDGEPVHYGAGLLRLREEQG
jgi:biotin carboxyl carrier protein